MTVDAVAQINLYDPALRAQQDPWTSRNLLRVSLLCLVVMGAWISWAQLQRARVQTAAAVLAPQLKEAQAEALRLAAQMAAHKPDEKLERELAELRERLRLRGDVLALLKKGLAPEAISQADVLRGLARQVPPGLWLTGFHVDAETGALEIIGRTNDPALIPGYVRQLGAEKAFVGRTFAALSIAHNKPQPVAAATTATPAPAGSAPVSAITPAVAPQAVAAAPAAPPAVPAFHEFRLSSTLADKSEAVPAAAAGARP